MTPCVCDGPGFCARHGCHKGTSLFHKCRTELAFWNQFESGSAPQQRPPEDSLRCQHRGEKTSTIGCAACCGKVAEVQLFACTQFGECQLWPTSEKDIPDCATCQRRDKPRLTAGGSQGTAVIIVSHNYGRFLADAVESVLTQDLPAREIVIVDDSSTDDTPQVAARYSGRVRYIRVEARSTFAARRAGFIATDSSLLCFLDADDKLPPNYLKTCAERFSDSRVGIVTTDLETFGDSSRVISHVREHLERQNYAHAGSLVRRAALDVSAVFDSPEGPGQEVHADWFVWRRIVRSGWTIADAPSVKYGYRQHGKSQSDDMRREATTYYDLAALAHETLTLFVPLAGRAWACDRLREFLDSQQWPHDRTRLILADTSVNPEFGEMIRHYLATCDYADYRYYSQSVADPGTADLPRENPRVRAAVQQAMCRIYNRMAREVTTEYVWVVEDDVIPPVDAAERLLRCLDANVASVSGAYIGRHAGQDKLVAWRADGGLLPATTEGVISVHGTGFGCVLLRRSVLADAVFQHVTPGGDYDPNFYHWLATTKFKAKLDCSIRCEHLSAPAADFTCVHRGDVSRQAPCELCGSLEGIADVHACYIHGECTIHSHGVRRDGPASEKLAVCIACEDRSLLENPASSTEQHSSATETNQSAVIGVPSDQRQMDD